MSTNVTQQEYDEMLQRARANAMANAAPAISQRHVEPRTPKRQWNKTEEAYSQLLEARRRVGQILDWKYEAITLKLADDCRYTPDFAVWLPDGSLHFHEVKGAHVRDDARAKYKAATALFPYFGWWWAQFKKGIWSIDQEPQTLWPGRVECPKP